MTAFSLVRKLIPVFLLMPATLMPQVIDIRDARTSVSVENLQPAPVLPSAKLTATSGGEVALLPGLFRERRELTKAYLLRLKSDDLLQNHLLEAGVRIDKPYEQMHQGWESPHCQLRGHFAGHWLSAVAHFAAIDHDPQLSARAADVVRGLDRCQTLNGGQWVGSIPEKYFEILAAGKEPIWSPQYTVHKTLMGLFDAYRYGGDKEALATVERSADWFLAWTDQCLREGRGEAIYGGECSG
ncbi:MAG: glycoside hydrolase family 127 protein, partial [Opitutaceae bacterium]|nr:glycoside hydrolase family 127 protein [Opitutaceae bacterium]